MDREGVKALAEALSTNKSLLSIDLSYIAIIDEQIAKEFISTLHFNFTILEIKFCNLHLQDVFCFEFEQRNKLLQWKNQHAILLEICIAMKPLGLPSYVLLWIYDQFGHGEASINQFKKVSLLESVEESARKIKRLRNQNF